MCCSAQMPAPSSLQLVLSSPSVDPKTLAPEGTVLNAKKVEDARAVVRVPFTQIVPLALQVVDTENTGSSGQGWKIGEALSRDQPQIAAAAAEPALSAAAVACLTVPALEGHNGNR